MYLSCVNDVFLFSVKLHMTYPKKNIYILTLKFAFHVISDCSFCIGGILC
jgi:hypothetical protein